MQQATLPLQKTLFPEDNVFNCTSRMSLNSLIPGAWPDILSIKSDSRGKKVLDYHFKHSDGRNKSLTCVDSLHDLYLFAWASTI